MRLPFIKYKKEILFSLLAIIAVYSSSYVFIVQKDKSDFPYFEINKTIDTLKAKTKAALPEIPEIRDRENPVNGVFVTKSQLDEMINRKLVVISLNNHSDSRPQFGLSRADLILEVLAEGGITRYNAYYYADQQVPKVGPIRSARSYMLEYFLGFDDPVFVHEGQASYPPQEKAVPETNTLLHISQWGINSMQTAGSRYRDPDRIKSAGYVHSLMTGFDLINKEIERLKWKETSDIKPLLFKNEEELENRGDNSNIKIQYSSLAGSQYHAEFNYDKESNSYLRTIGGKADIDALDNSRIAPKVVVVEFHDYRDARDGHSRIILDMIGKDDVYIFQDGQMIKGYWQKSDRKTRTRYYDETGKEIEINRGQIWVSIAAKTSANRISVVTHNGQQL